MNYNEMIKRLAEKGYSIVDPMSFYEKIDESSFSSLVSDIDAYAAEMDERSKTQKLEEQLTSNYRRIIDILGQTPEYINGTPGQKEAVDSALRSIYGKYISFASADDKRAELDSIESELARTRAEIIRIRDDSTISAEEKGARYPALFSEITSLTNAKKEKEAELQAEYADLRERQSIGPRVVMESPFPGGDGKYTTPDGVEHTYGNIEVTYPDFFEEFDALFYAVRALNIPNDQEIMTCRDRMLQAARRIKDHDVVRRRVTSEDLEEKLVNYGIVRNAEASRDAIMPNTPVETPASTPEPAPEVAPIEPPASAPEPAPEEALDSDGTKDFEVGEFVKLSNKAEEIKRLTRDSSELPAELRDLLSIDKYRIAKILPGPRGERKIGILVDQDEFGFILRYVPEKYLAHSRFNFRDEPVETSNIEDDLDLVRFSAESIAELSAKGAIPEGVTLDPNAVYRVVNVDYNKGKITVMTDISSEKIDGIIVDRKDIIPYSKKEDELKVGDFVEFPRELGDSMEKHNYVISDSLNGFDARGQYKIVDITPGRRFERLIGIEVDTSSGKQVLYVNEGNFAMSLPQLIQAETLASTPEPAPGPEDYDEESYEDEEDYLDEEPDETKDFEVGEEVELSIEALEIHESLRRREEEDPYLDIDEELKKIAPELCDLVSYGAIRIAKILPGPRGERKIGVLVDSDGYGFSTLRYVPEKYLDHREPVETSNIEDDLDLVKISAEGIAELSAEGITLDPNAIYRVIDVDYNYGEITVLTDISDDGLAGITVDRKDIIPYSSKKEDELKVGDFVEFPREWWDEMKRVESHPNILEDLNGVDPRGQYKIVDITPGRRFERRIGIEVDTSSGKQVLYIKEGYFAMSLPQLIKVETLASTPEPAPEDDFIVGNMVELNEEARSALKSDEIPEELQIGLYPGVEYKIAKVRRNPFGTREIGLEIESLWGKQVRFVSEHYLSPSKTHISGYDPSDLVKISAEGIAELAAIGKIPKGITLKPTELYVVMGIDAKTGKVQILVDDINEVEIPVDRKYLTLATKKKNEPIPDPEVAPVEPPVSAPAAPNPTSDIVIGSIVAPDIGAIMAGYPEVEGLSLIKDYEVVEIKDGSPRTIGIKEIENGKTVGPVRYVTEEKLLSKLKKAPEKKSTPISSEDFEVGGFAKVISEIAVTECKKRYEIDIEKGKEYKIVELRPDWVVLDINGEHIPVRRSYAIKTRKKSPEPVKPEKPITAAASGIAVGDYVRLSEYGIKNCKDLSSTSGPGYKLDVFDEYKVLGVRTAVEGKQHFITIALGDQKVEFDSKVFELYRKSHEAKAVVESGDFVKLNNRREPKSTESDDAFDKIFELFNKDPYKELDPSKEYEVVRVTDGGKSYEIKVGDKIESYEAKYFDLSKKKKVVKAEGARKDTGAASAPETPVSAPAPETPVEPPKPVRRLVTSAEEKKLTDRMCTVYLALGIIGTLSALVLSGGGLFVLAAVGTTIITALRKSYAVSGILNPIDRKLISKFRKLAKTAKEKAKERFADEMTSGEEDALDDIDKAADEMDKLAKPAEKAKDPSARTI